MFQIAVRQRIRERLIERAWQDPAIAAAAAVGSSAGSGDRWSDLDLTFAVADGRAIADVLAAWTEALAAEFGAAVLFDLPLHTTIYRVFLLPGALQVDLSFTPAADFAPRGPRFQLLFGETAIVKWPPSPPYAPAFDLGLAVHHLVRTRICIERSRLWQAEYWLHEARDLALTLACHRLGLDTHYGRGFDALPPELLAALASSLPTAMTAPELHRGLTILANVILAEAEHISSADPRIGAIIKLAGVAGRD